MEILSQQFRVPEIYGDYWLNADPIPIAASRGYVILIDFWDYCCQHCLNAIPYLKEWYRRYSDKGLILISVHTPQFPFARDPLHVRKAVDKLGIKYPVVMDNDYFIWNAYRCAIRPTKCLVDKHGFLRFVHAGEGQYQNFEHAIQSLLADAGYRDEFPIVMEPIKESDKPGAMCYKPTPEIFTGWQRGTIGNREGFSPESTVHYEDPGYHVEGRVYLSGDWFSDRNFIRLHTENPKGGYIAIRYQAKEVTGVFQPEGEKGFQVFVEQNMNYLTNSNAGDDIRFDEQKRSFFIVNEARIYNIVKNKEFGEYELKLSTRSNGCIVYGFYFSTSVIPELIQEG